MVENDRILEGLLLEWEKFHWINHKQSSKQKPNHQIKQQWSMVVIRDSPSHNDLSVFPPINHENLHRQIQQQQYDAIPNSTHLPPSNAGDVTPSAADGGIRNWWGTGLEILRAKIVSLTSYFGCKDATLGRAFRSFRRVVGVAAVVLLWWLCKRVRRRMHREENVERLKMIIKEKDERIAGLLKQIAEINEVLVARHKAIASKLTD